MIAQSQILTAIIVLSTLFYASVQDFQNRRVSFRTWYLIIFLAIPLTAYFYIYSETPVQYLAPSLVLSAIFYYLAYKKWFGGADAWALILSTICLPVQQFGGGIVNAVILTVPIMAILYLKDGKVQKIPFVIAITAGLIVQVVYGNLSAPILTALVSPEGIVMLEIIALASLTLLCKHLYDQRKSVQKV